MHGLEGFEKKGIIAYLKDCPVRADQRASKPAEQPVPHAIVVNRVYEQCQVGTGGEGQGRRADEACRTHAPGLADESRLCMGACPRLRPSWT